ncbi:MAG: hypothetical protein HY682_03180, partial [Chloroflexi bacterium]|nr:hypothetical protein [Chloroflexota bacterium]
RTARTLMEEIVAVGRSQGVKFAPDVIESRIKDARSDAPNLVASMQLDFNAGGKLELENLIGAVVATGRKAGVPVPASAALYGALWKFRSGAPRETGR